MGMIINIDKALELRTDYNVLREPLNDMLRAQQEAWEKKNPIDLLFVRNSIDRFQQTFTSSIGFDRAFKETSDYNIGPIFNTAEGFSATYTTRTFQGSFIITQQTLEDRELGRVKDDASRFVKRWQGDTVDYAMAAIQAGFGKEVTFQDSRLLLTTADSKSGDIYDPDKAPLFYNAHKTVKRSPDATPISQSNIFYAGIDTTKEDGTIVAKLADVINQVITIMENYRDDNGKRASVDGAKMIVCGNDPHLKAYLNAAVSMDAFGGKPNDAYQRATVESTPYLLDIDACKDGKGFFIVDKSYNAANHGPEFTERVAFTLNVKECDEPMGIKYSGRQRFDINVATWRGIAYVYVGTPAGQGEGGWDALANFKKITPSVEMGVKPVSVVNTVKTQA